ncbi:MAG TPA: tetratricopeptide repeat protein [Burkholderiales bacterium]|nr:tetratricopeptide repeat protein [Burkholderiales bacterium]
MRSSPILLNLERLLAAGKDSALLRFGIGTEHWKAGDAQAAAEHLRRAVELDPDYSAAWKLLGQALARAGRLDDALEAYRRGIEAAERKGDKQAAREMAVFAKRIEKRISGPAQ